MIRLLICILLTAGISSQLTAQFSDDFSTPGLQDWSGDVDDFTINAQEELQLNADMAGTSWMYTNAQVPDSAVWELYVRLEFSPSGSNNFKWVLQSTTASRNELNGYGLTLGESGSDDALEFVRWDQGTSNILGQMASGFAGSDPVNLKIKVLRQNEQLKILASYEGTDVYTDTLEVVDDTYSGGPSLYSGIICNYTSTRVNLFYFDDYLIARQTPDKEAPQLLNHTVSEDQIILEFNEVVFIDDATFDIQPGNFQINASIIGNGGQVQLEVDPGFTSLTEYELSISGLEDISGNEASLIEIPFRYILTRETRPFDIVINEIMAAPNNTTSLPNVEYLELYNRSGDYLSLGDLFLLDNTKANDLPDYTFAPDSHIIICGIDDTSQMSVYGEVIGVDGFINLNNASDFIQLRDGNGQFIHGVDYTDNWYKDNQKDDGGWSLELIHPDLACSQEAAFVASDSPLGGSPGEQNSVYNPAFEDSLQLLLTGLVDQGQIKLTFNQWLLPSDTSLHKHIEINPAIGIDQAELRMERPDILDLILQSELEEGDLYDIEFASSLKNCLGEPIGSPLTTQLGIPAIPATGDLLISEIMFDPNSGESQWVEIYNSSDRIFDFRYLVLKVIDADGEAQTTIGLENQILPGQYFVLSENSSQVAETYNAPFPNQILEVDLPSIDRDAGAVQLWYIFGAEAHSLDSVCYSEDWHSGFLRDEKGVSLERLRLDLPACESGNWQSAAEAKQYGTPTGINSQMISPPVDSVQAFSLLHAVFSPDGDGFQDVAVVQYANPSDQETPPQINMKIYTPDGRLVNPLYSNYGLSVESQLIWDGRMTNGNLAPEGFYIIQLETFHESGDTGRWRGTVYLVYPN